MTGGFIDLNDIFRSVRLVIHDKNDCNYLCKKLLASDIPNKSVNLLKLFCVFYCLYCVQLLIGSLVLDMPTRTKLSNRKTDLANHEVKPKSDPLDSVNIVLDNKKLDSLAKSLPKIKKIKKEKVEVASSVTKTSCSGIKKESLEELINPDVFLLNPDNTEDQVIFQFI